MKLNIPRADTKSAKNGKWFPFMNGVSFLIARSNSREYLKDLSNALKSHKEFIEADPKDSSGLQARIMAELYADHLLLNWKGLIDTETGNEIPYSHSFAVKLLSDEEYGHIYKFVSAKSGNEANYYIEEKEKALKKS